MCVRKKRFSLPLEWTVVHFLQVVRILPHYLGRFNVPIRAELQPVRPSVEDGGKLAVASMLSSLAAKCSRLHEEPSAPCNDPADNFEVRGNARKVRRSEIAPHGFQECTCDQKHALKLVKRARLAWGAKQQGKRKQQVEESDTENRRSAAIASHRNSPKFGQV